MILLGEPNITAALEKKERSHKEEDLEEDSIGEKEAATTRVHFDFKNKARDHGGTETDLYAQKYQPIRRF